MPVPRVRAEPGPRLVDVEFEHVEPEGDHFPLNNVIETFVTVSKEGVSVLLVDRIRSGEPQSICDVLADGALRARLGTCGRRRVRERFDIARTVTALAERYSDAAE